MVEANAFKYGFLAVTYDRFEFGSGQNIDDISLQYHLRNVITRILVSFLSYLSEWPDVSKNLSKDEKRQLSIFIHTYLGELTGDEIQEVLNELKSLPDKFKDFWRQNVGFMESAINFLLKNYDLESVDLPDVKQEEKRLGETYKFQLETLLKLVKKIGFKSIYVLIDRPDETEKTGNNPEATYQLIKPLIKDLELLGLPGYGFKFFLWDKIEPFFREDARPDRVPQYELKWTRKNLVDVLSKRLKAFSNGDIKSFDYLLEVKSNIDEKLCLLANGSPRNLIRLCEKILAIQGARDPDSNKISQYSIDQASVDHSEQLSIEHYGEGVIREIQRVGNELFTTNYVANSILKISSNGARNKITGWVNVGMVSQVGSVVVPPATRPTHLYAVIDPCVVRLMHRVVPFEKFIQDRWLPCEHCLTDNLINIELYPEGQEPVCRQCGRDLL
ncbi:MAG: hypothetical protein CMK89_00975 [Pseudomonadales bacterium]|nr:hypothetical protein [Pseudomonadales bacterium]